MLKRNKLLVLLFAIILICGCGKEKPKDSIEFKEEYESYNDSLKSVNINEDNPFMYKTHDEVLSLIDSEKALVIFYGDAKNEESRNIVEFIIKTAKEKGLSRIYYVPLNGGEYNIKNETINKTTLVGILRKEIYMLAETDADIVSTIEKIATELSKCDIDYGC